MPDIDALSDGGFCEMGTYPGIQVSDRPGVPEELASTLRHLNLKEVERRRRLLSNNTRSVFTSSSYCSPPHSFFLSGNKFVFEEF